MLEVKIPADIQEYKSKLIAGLSTRQVIGIAGALVCAVPLGIYGSKFISEDILPWIIIIVVAPFAGYGFMKFKDMNFETFMGAWLNMMFLPQTRVYEDTDVNLFSNLNEELLEIDMVQQHIENGDYDIQEEWRG